MQGKCVIFSAPSGAGKTTLVKHLLKQDLSLEFSVSACSRERRPKETPGKDYYFFTVPEFRKKIEANEFIEWEEVYTNHLYGTLKSEITRIWEKGKHVIFDVDVVGGLNLKKKFGAHALAVFVKAPTIAHLESRLQSRATETPESIARRIGKAHKEMNYSNDFDAIIVNDDLYLAKKEALEVVSRFIRQA